MNTKTGKFDLNMEDVLEAWGPADGARELIANALDEHALTDTQEPDISQDDKGRWHIRDFGRGLRYDHFTQAENEEKLERPDTVIREVRRWAEGCARDLPSARYQRGYSLEAQHVPNRGSTKASVLHKAA